jgi:hypothetical protein
MAESAVDGIERQIGQVSDKIAAIDEDVAAVGRHFGQLAAARMVRQEAFDDLNRRLDRIEQQLGLSS